MIENKFPYKKIMGKFTDELNGIPLEEYCSIK